MDRPLILIADIGSNWCVDYNLDTCWEHTCKLIKDIADAGVDYVKFQLWDADTFIDPDHRDAVHYHYYQVPTEWYERLIQECVKHNIKFMCSCFDIDIAKTIHILGQQHNLVWKIPSGDVNYLPLIKTIVGFGDPMVISTGSATDDEIRTLMELTNGLDVTWLHCINRYPIMVNDIDPDRYRHIQRLTNTTPGWSSHVTPNRVDGYFDAARIMYALGARTMEFHVTSNIRPDTPDQLVSVVPNDLYNLRLDIVFPDSIPTHNDRRDPNTWRRL